MKDIQKTVLELQQEVASLRQLQETTQSESLDLSNANRTNPRVANETQDTKVEPSIPPQGEETAAPPVNTTNQSESAPQQTPVEEERQSSDIIAPTPQASENIATVVPTEQEEAKNPPTTSEQQPQTDTLANPAESTTPPVSEEITDTESDLPLVEQILQTNPDLDQRLTELSKEQGDSFNENDLFNYLIVRIKQHAEDLSSPLDLKRIADVTLAEIKKRREQQSHTTTIATPPIAIHEETPKQPSIEKQIDTTTPIPQEKSRETAPKIEAVREEPKEPAEVVQKEEVLTPAKAEQIAGPTPMISTETVPVKQPEQSYPRPKEALVASVNPDQKEIQEDLPLISQVLTHYPDLQQKLIELSGTNLDTYTNSMLFDALLVQIAQKYSIQDISKMPELRNRISNVMLVEIKRRREQRNNHPIVSSQPLATEISQSAPTERAMSATPQVTTERAKAPEGILGRVRGLFSRRSQVQPKS